MKIKTVANVVSWVIAVPIAIYSLLALFGNAVNAQSISVERSILGVGLSMVVLMLFAIFISTKATR